MCLQVPLASSLDTLVRQAASLIDTETGGMHGLEVD